MFINNLKLTEEPVELTQKLATTPHPWYSYVVNIVSHYYAGVIEDL